MRNVALWALVAAACAPPAKAPARDDDPGAVRVLESGAVIRTGRIGTGAPEDGTYVLVEVANDSKVDRLVTLDGALLADGGATLARLPADELRVPAGGRRAFALVAPGALPEAHKATFHVGNAVGVAYPPEVALEDSKLTPGPIPVVTARVRNAIDRDVSAVVAVTFRDQAGKILARPFTVVPLPIGATRPVRFEGPPEARSGEAFVGQVAFHN